MITKIAIENFKGIGERVELELKPLTLLFGPNSGGKSTILQALHYAREIFERLNPNADRTISGGDFVDLGGFANLLHDHDLRGTVWLRLDWVDCHPRDDRLYERQLVKDMDAVKRYLQVGYEDGIPDFDRLCWSGEKGDVSIEVGIRWDSATNEPHISTYRLYLEDKLMAEVTSEPSLKRVYLSRLELDHPLFVSIGSWLCDDEEGGQDLPYLRQYYDNPEATCLSLCWGDASKWFQPVEGSAPAPAENTFVPILLQGQTCALPLPGEKIKFAIPYANRLQWERDPLAQEIADALSRILTAPIELMRDHLKRFRYLGPLREMPSREHAAPRSPDDSRWSSGLGAWDELQTGDAELVRAVSSWLGDKGCLDTGYTIQRREFKPVDVNNPTGSSFLAGEASLETAEDARRYLNRSPTPARLVICPNQRDVKLDPHDVGVGISQVVPVVVTALAGRNRLVAIEQPELHLHPRLQAILGDLFIEAAVGYRKHTVILETHSEHLILRLLRRIRETTAGELPPGHPGLRPDQLAVFWVDRGPNGSTVRELRVDETGEFVDKWPQGFFEERAKELF